jgi:hypothetical protein
VTYGSNDTVVPSVHIALRPAKSQNNRPQDGFYRHFNSLLQPAEAISDLQYVLVPRTAIAVRNIQEEAAGLADGKPVDTNPSECGSVIYQRSDSFQEGF